MVYPMNIFDWSLPMASDKLLTTLITRVLFEANSVEFPIEMADHLNLDICMFTDGVTLTFTPIDGGCHGN